MNVSMRCFERLSAMRALVVVTGVLLAAVPAWAHKSSDAYLQLQGDARGVSTLRVDVALRDLDAVLDLDADGDGRLTWGEIKASWPAIDRYVQANVRLDGCRLTGAAPALERRSDGVYAALAFAPRCSGGGVPEIRYTLFADVDPTHRGLARIEIEGRPTSVEVLDPRQPRAAKSASGTASGEPRTGFLGEGVQHILTGYDHVLFLLCLLLPAVMRRTPSGWQPVERIGQALWPTVAIVTTFTVAHSITLALAALGLIALPSWFIEPAIAVTIVLAALDNLWPIFRGRRGAITFAFGMIHGFGFAGVLAELHLPTSQFAWALLQFNLGLELGQLAIVAAALGVLYFGRQRRRYVGWVLQGGSSVAIVIGVVWFIQRTAQPAWLQL